MGVPALGQAQARAATPKLTDPSPQPYSFLPASFIPRFPRSCPQLHVDNLAVLPTNVQVCRRFNHSDVTSPSIAGLKMDKTSGSEPVTLLAVEMLTQHKEGLSTS
jgi:hypothetical protein